MKILTHTLSLIREYKLKNSMPVTLKTIPSLGLWAVQRWWSRNSVLNLRHRRHFDNTDLSDFLPPIIQYHSLNIESKPWT